MSTKEKLQGIMDQLIYARGELNQIVDPEVRYNKDIILMQSMVIENSTSIAIGCQRTLANAINEIDNLMFYLDLMKENPPPMKKLSRFKTLEKEAIKKSMYLWKWLSENPLSPKYHYPHYERDIESCFDDCPCCDFYLEKSKSKTCKDCPVYDEGMDCFEFESDFKNWFRTHYNSDTNANIEYATKISLRLKKTYYKMGGRIRI